MDNITIITVYQRLKSSTPKFWKKVRWMMVACGSIGAAIMALPKEYTVWVPQNIPGMLMTAGAIGTALASLTVQDAKQKSDG